MSKHTERRHKAKMIRAAAAPHSIQCDVESIDWIKAAEGEQPAADAPKRFKMRAYTGGPMQVGYYGAPVVIELSGLTAKAPLPILMNHDMDKIVGHADEVAVGDASLDLTGAISGGGREAEQVLTSAKLGFPWKASVGARPDKMEFIGEGISTKVNGKTFTGPLYVARKSTLGEVSFVPMAADSKTSAKVAASAAFSGKDIDMDFAQWIQAKGFDPATLTETQTAFFKAMYEEEHATKPAVPPAAPPVSPTDDPAVRIRADAAAETVRITAVRKICEGKFPEIEAKAIADGWTETKTELEVMRAARPKSPEVRPGSQDRGDAVIEAAFAQTLGLRDREKMYPAPILEAADRMRGFGLGELLLHYAMRAGYSGRMKVNEGNLRQVLKAAFSVHSLTTLLTNLGHKTLLEGFNAIPQSWREVAQVRPVSDFKTWTFFRMTADMEFKEVGPGGEIQHGSLGQESYTMQAKTYARMLALTRQDIINDDLGAFNDIRNRMGIGAAIALNKAFWTAWTAAYNGAAFWTAARANLVTSAALAEAGMAKAVMAFRKLAAPDGNMMNLQPDRILIPPDLEVTGRKLYVSQEMRDMTASTKFQTSNIYFNQFRPIVVPELGNSAYTGYSLTTWYMLANPAVLASGLVCFLNGQESPTIESADADFETLGIQFRGYTDFGVAMSEYRASVANEA